MKQTTTASKPEARVGIFWIVDGELLIDSTLLSEAEEYDDFRIHPRDHISVWETFQQNGTVPREVEYEESPRVRVMFDTRTNRFTLLADHCILKDKILVRKIMQAVHLPRNTELGADAHYRCSRLPAKKS